jgi:hypothetical protein
VNANCANGGKVLHEPWLAVLLLAIYYLVQSFLFGAVIDQGLCLAFRPKADREDSYVRTRSTPRYGLKHGPTPLFFRHCTLPAKFTSTSLCPERTDRNADAHLKRQMAANLSLLKERSCDRISIGPVECPAGKLDRSYLSNRALVMPFYSASVHAETVPMTCPSVHWGREDG